MIDVHAPLRRFREALAELPLSARSGEAPRGAIVVVPGEVGWVDAALTAASAGAVALVIADPVFVPAADLHRIAEVAGIPVIVERPLLRPDVTGDAVAARTGPTGWAQPRVLVAEVAASRAPLTGATRDAVGWLRILAGETPTLVVADEGLILLETSGGIAATLTAVATARTDAGRVRVQALGEVTTDVEVERHAVRLATAGAAGRLIAPTRFESSERLALRRAIEAVEAHTTPADLHDLVADTELVEQILVPTA